MSNVYFVLHGGVNLLWGFAWRTSNSWMIAVGGSQDHRVTVNLESRPSVLKAVLAESVGSRWLWNEVDIPDGKADRMMPPLASSELIWMGIEGAEAVVPVHAEMLCARRSLMFLNWFETTVFQQIANKILSFFKSEGKKEFPAGYRLNGISEVPSPHRFCLNYFFN